MCSVSHHLIDIIQSMRYLRWLVRGVIITQAIARSTQISRKLMYYQYFKIEGSRCPWNTTGRLVVFMFIQKRSLTFSFYERTWQYISVYSRRIPSGTEGLWEYYERVAIVLQYSQTLDRRALSPPASVPGKSTINISSVKLCMVAVNVCLVNPTSWTALPNVELMRVLLPEFSGPRNAVTFSHSNNLHANIMFYIFQALFPMSFLMLSGSHILLFPVWPSLRTCS